MRSILAIALFLGTVSFSQDLILKNYSVDDGLPSSEVHDIYQDKRGYLWFATDRGIVRYNGSEFLIKDKENGLPTNVVFNFYEESQNKVWISTKENNLFHFDPLSDNWRFKEFDYNEKLTEAFALLTSRSSVEFIRDFWYDEKGIFCFTFLTGTGLIKLYPDGEYEIQYRGETNFYKHKTDNILIHYTLVDGEPRLFSEFIQSTGDKAGKIKFYDHQKKDTVNTDIEFDLSVRWQYGIADMTGNEQEVKFIIGKYLFRYRNNKLDVVDLPVEALRIHEDNELTYVSTFRGVYTLNSNLEIIGSFLNDHIVTALCKDFEGGFWFSTVQKGIFYNNNQDIHTYHTDIEIISESITCDDNWILCGNINETISIINRQGQIIDHFDKTGYDDEYYVTNGHNLTKYLVPLWQDPEFPDLRVYVDKRSKSASDSLISLSGNGKIGIHAKDTSYSINLKGMNLNEHLQVNDSIIYLTTNTGLYVFNRIQQNIKPYIEKVEWAVPMNEIVPFYRGYAITTEGDGLIYIRDSSFYRITKSNGLISNSIVDILVENDTVLWVGTLKGLNRVRVKNQNGGIIIEQITSESGLLDNEITCMSSYKDTLWIGTKKGICFFPSELNSLSKKLIPDFFKVDSVLVNGNHIYFGDAEINLDFGNSVDVYFNQVTYFVANELNYEYKINERENRWFQTNANHLSLPPLNPGNYTVLIRPIHFSARSSLIELHFTVNAPFWMTWWFIALGVMGFIGFLLLLIRIILNRLDKQKQKELDKLKLELKALIAQMNPHFTFNTINSIQHYIIKKDKKEALNYLAEFALLMRRTLEYSRREFITLREEIEFLKLYADLENKRFDKPFTLKFNVECTSSHDDIEFPALLLQPILENAIIHGVTSLKKTQGKIEISIQEFNDYFNVKIVDNGTGKKTKKVKIVGKKNSYGLDILRQRLKIYNGQKYNVQDIAINYIENSGVEVNIKLYKQDLM